MKKLFSLFAITMAFVINAHAFQIIVPENLNGWYLCVATYGESYDAITGKQMEDFIANAHLADNTYSAEGANYLVEDLGYGHANPPYEFYCGQIKDNAILVDADPYFFSYFVANTSTLEEGTEWYLYAPQTAGAVTLDETMLVHHGILGQGIIANPVYTIFSWESPDGVPVGFGGMVAYEDGDSTTNRYNYANGDYHTLCLNGKKANLEDLTASTNAGHISFLLDNDIVAGDTIFLTAYYNKGEDKQVSAFFKTRSGVEFSSDVVTADIARGAQPEEIKVIVPKGVHDHIFYMTRDLTGTNMFITKMVIKGKRSTPIITATAAVHQFSTMEDLENLTITLSESDLTVRENYDGWLICDALHRMYAAWAPAFGAGSTYTLNDGVMTVDAFAPIADVTKDLPEEATDLFLVCQNVFEGMGTKKISTPIRYVPAGPTAVENTTATVKAQKLIENGQMVIIREGKRYNAVGAEL